MDRAIESSLTSGQEMKSISKDLEPLHKDCDPLQNIEKNYNSLTRFMHFALSSKKTHFFRGCVPLVNETP